MEEHLNIENDLQTQKESKTLQLYKMMQPLNLNIDGVEFLQKFIIHIITFLRILMNKSHSTSKLSSYSLK
jgi:hypothetical protein